MNNEKTITIKPDRRKIFEIYQDRKREMPDHITETVQEDITHFLLALWGAWQMQENDHVSADDLGNLVIQYQQMSSKLSKVLSLAKLAQYSTGFELPEDAKFYGFSIEDLTNNHNGETK